MDINNFKIGNGKTYIIAEAGLNHDGKLSQAKKLIKEAAKIGVDAIKFQIFKTEELCTENTEYFDLFKSLELPTNEWIEIADLARDIGITFTASVFGEQSTDLLNEIKSPLYKISSGDLTYSCLLKYVAKKNKPIILSTGMSNIGEINQALNCINSSGNYEVALMHCISDYPTAYQDINLKFIQILKNIFKIPVGFSDHTKGIIIPCIAVANGADIIEKHFTLNNNLPGPDHQLSLEPKEFEAMIRDIRITETSLGNGIKKLTEGEKEAKKLARRSITSIENIDNGELITRDKVRVLRPGLGIEPQFLDKIIGKSVNKTIKKNQPITWDCIC